MTMRFMRRVVRAAVAAAFLPVLAAQETAPTAGGADTATAAAAAVTVRPESAAMPDFLEHAIDAILALFDIHSSGNTLTHYCVSALLFVLALLARQIVTGLFFPTLKRLAAKTESTLDDKMFPALEGPVAALTMTVGMFASLKVLKLSTEADFYLGNGARVAFSLAIFWTLWRALGTLLAHGGEIARRKNLGIAAFMPWISKTLLTVFSVVAILLTVQSMGYDVKAILAGLGIGGLAFALAAQDTLANIFGAIVVAVDQPFKIGEVVRIGANVGAIEDIGLRSTRIRLLDKSLMVIPNKTVASDTITNLSRFTRRRIEQTIGLTYSSKPEQMEEMVTEIRRILTAQPEVDAAGVMVFFRDFSASSLDIWMVYEVLDPDIQKALGVRQRVNVAIMQAVEARGLSFAFPTQTVHLDGEVAQRLAGGRGSGRAEPPAGAPHG